MTVLRKNHQRTIVTIEIISVCSDVPNDSTDPEAERTWRQTKEVDGELAYGSAEHQTKARGRRLGVCIG